MASRNQEEINTIAEGAGFRKKKKPDTSNSSFANDETDEEKAAREDREKSREEDADQASSRSQPGDWDYKEGNADKEDSSGGVPIKKNTILKLSNPAEQQKSLPYQPPAEGESDLNDSQDHNEASQMPEHRRVKVKVPKKSEDLW